jgi:hypothetical protein
LQEATKANPYEYANDDPVNATDPSGALALWECALLGAGTFLANLSGIGGVTSGGNALLGIAKILASGEDIAGLLATVGIKIAAESFPVLGWIALGVSAVIAAGATVVALKTAGCI